MHHVELMSVPLLTDQLLHDILAENPLAWLEVLRLDHCHNITMEGIGALLTENRLKQLNLDHCKQITMADADEINQLITQMNWDLEFTWL